MSRLLQNVAQQRNCCSFQQIFRQNMSYFIVLTILTGKNFRTNSVQDFVKIESWLLVIDLFDMFTQATKVYELHCLILTTVYV